jgi:hypothetical protein
MSPDVVTAGETASEVAQTSELRGTGAENRRASFIYRPSSVGRTFSVELEAAPRESLAEAINRILDLLTWSEGWNGYEVDAPNPQAVDRAIPWIVKMYTDALATGEEWHNTHVTADEDGDVMLEWWNNGKGLTIYVSEEDTTYLKASGTSMTNDMEDGEATTSEVRRRLWAWLLS